MGAKVFANGLEVSGKASPHKTIAAFPDVCFTPPQTPATPPGVPIPYPSFGMSSDTEKGTSTVKVGGKPANLKNKSDLSKTTGTEAGSAPKKGIVSSKNTGKSFFNSWSMDVKFEGEPVIRFTDLATHNHGSPFNAPPWLHTASLSVGGNDCAHIVAEIHDYRQKKECPDGYQSHHMIENCSFTMTGARSVALKNLDSVGGSEGRQKRNLFQPDGNTHPGVNYDEYDAPCICLEGSKSDPNSEHGTAHAVNDDWADLNASDDRKWTYEDAREAAVDSIVEAKGLEDWEGECVGLVLDQYYQDTLGCTDSTEMVSPPGQSSAVEFDDGHGNMITAYELV